MAIGPEILGYIESLVYHMDTLDSTYNAWITRRQLAQTNLVPYPHF